MLKKELKTTNKYITPNNFFLRLDGKLNNEKIYIRLEVAQLLY